MIGELGNVDMATMDNGLISRFITHLLNYYKLLFIVTEEKKQEQSLLLEIQYFMRFTWSILIGTKFLKSP